MLLVAASLIMTLGMNLYYISEKTQDKMKSAFVTIGTVEQKPSNVTMEKYWNPYTREYEYGSDKKYDAPISDAVLDIEGISYIHEPKQRPYYVACNESYVVRDAYGEVDESWLGMEAYNVIAEVTPYEDCIPDHPVKLKFNRSLYGKTTEKNTYDIWFWDYTNPEPDPLYAGKTYIMALYRNISLDWFGLVDSTEYPEIFTPWLYIDGEQYTESGEKILDEEYENQFCSEVIDGFYETDEGKRWLNLIEGFELSNYSIPVIPTDATKLLMYFYNGDAGIVVGRDITEEEYDSGEKVCLIEQKFAKLNELKIGEMLELPLYYADYAYSAGFAFPLDSNYNMHEKLINADGECYQPFEVSEYKIVGIYQVNSGAQDYSGYSAAENGVIIPANSVKNSESDNIIAYGPMKGYNTVFQIENGTIDEFGEVWSQQENNELEIRFYDGGYTEIEQSFENTRRISIVLLSVGVATVILLMLFFCHLFISKQKLRMAIERSLGMNKNQCRVSILSGLLAVTIFGTGVGCVLGNCFTNMTVSALSKSTDYSTMYSANKIVTEELFSVDYFLAESDMGIVLAIISGIFILIVACMIAVIITEKSLKAEPLELLAKMKREI